MAYEAWTVEWDMPVLLEDPFRRDVSNGWGTAPGGQPWGLDTNPPADFNVVNGVGTHTHTGTVLLHHSHIDIGSTDGELVAEVTIPVFPTGGSISARLAGRFTDTSNYYDATLLVATSGAVSLSLGRRLGGAGSSVAGAVTLGSTHAAGDTWVIRFSFVGSVFRAMAWKSTEDPPASWIVSGVDTGITTGTRIACQDRLEGGNTNPTPVMISWDNVRVTVPERWVDITSRVDTAAAGPFQITSGDTPESSADTGGFGLPIQNHDQAFTPGNVVSPYAPNIAPGSRIRVRETIGDRVFERGYGYVQYPEIMAWTESNEDSPRDQLITIPVVDRAAWIAQGRTMISTLGEHILYHGGPALIAWWPMGETEGPDVNPAVGGPWTISRTQRYNTLAFAPDAGPAAISFGGTGVAPADDLTAVTFEPSTTQAPTPDYVTSLMLKGKRPAPLRLAAGQTLTVVCWTRPGELVPGALVFTLIEVAAFDAFGNYTAFAGINTDSNGNLQGYANNVGFWNGTVIGPPVPAGHSMPIAMRVSFSPAVLQLWVRGEVYTGSLSVPFATPMLCDTMDIAERYPGAVNHAQVYLGDAGDWTNDDFVAQHQMGLYGLERQSTGERIRTMLGYAGVDPSEMGRIDDGVSLMQTARLAGRNPMDVIADAVATEQGEFYIDGGNRPVFADRVRLYNV